MTDETKQGEKGNEQYNGISANGDLAHILIANDDGIDAPGIKALYDALVPIARISLVAPARERSAVGHAISVYNDLNLHKKYLDDGSFFGYALDGTPADCVKWAVTALLRDDTGNNIIYSGTVAAAREGAMFEIPSIAVSLSARRDETPHFETAAQFTARLAPFVIETGLPPGVLLNVNVPNVIDQKIKGVEVSRMGKAMFIDEFEFAGDKAEFVAVRNVGKELVFTADDGLNDSDDLVLRSGRISITPLQYDLTHHTYRQELERWLADRLDSLSGEAIVKTAEKLSRELTGESD
jgi:5'-nucleotidase